MSDEVRTRFAPSPTGYLHLGGLRTALYTYLFAKKHGGKFILRIEDTDQEREVPGAVDLIYKSMRQAGLTYDEGPDVGGDYGPYIQTQRRDLYPKYAWELVEKGGAYCCFCTKEEIEADRKAAEAKGETYKYNKKCLHNVSLEEAKRRIAAGEPYVIRQNVPTTGKASFDDMLYGHVEVDCDTLDDNVLIKADGLPTYNFANVVDDHLMAISHVMRGTEYLSSAPKYNLLYEAFGWKPPIYLHLPPVMIESVLRDKETKQPILDENGNEQPIVRKVFRTLQRRLREQNGLSLGYLWRSTLRDCRAQVGLGTQECDILCDAANYLGRYDADEQLTGLSQVERRLAASREAAQEDLANRGNLYRTCGIALGLLVILVLI